MDVFPKFIIEFDAEFGLCLILSNVTYHKELTCFPENVKGGGFYHIADKTITFSGESSDFGEATIEDILTCINTGNVYASPILDPEYSIVNQFNFNYRTGSETIILKK